MTDNPSKHLPDLEMSILNASEAKGEVRRLLYMRLREKARLRRRKERREPSEFQEIISALKHNWLVSRKKRK